MTITVAQRHAANLDPVGDPHVVLLEFSEDGSGVTHRAAINTENVVYDGNEYVAADIAITLPSAGDAEPSVRVEMSNVDRLIGSALSFARNRVGCRMLLVTGFDTSSPPEASDLLIDTRNLFIINSASVDSDRVSSTLGPRMSLQEPVPFRRTTRALFPGVWFQPK